MSSYASPAALNHYCKRVLGDRGRVDAQVWRQCCVLRVICSNLTKGYSRRDDL